MNLKFWKPKPLTPPPTIKVVNRDSSQINIAAWRKEETLVALAAKVLRDEGVRSMLAVLDNEHPGKRGVTLGTPIDQRAIMQSIAQGYQLCLNNLRAMGEKPNPRRVLEETWDEKNLGGNKA